VSIDNGYLKILLTQEQGLVDGSQGIISRGGMIYTKAQCGYGTYQWTMRMSSNSSSPTGLGTWVSGSVSAGFNYVNNSQTEIDFEYSAATPASLWMVNWLNPNPRRNPTSSNETATFAVEPDAPTTFHTYTFVWTSTKISYYIDGTLTSEHTTNIPTAPAYFMINHWGTNSLAWGGLATPGTARYFYVDTVSFTPQ
jgi:endo-1,3-1,4-beta-glycanase ExoK